MLVLYCTVFSLKWLPKSVGILEYQNHLLPEFCIEFYTGYDIARATLMVENLVHVHVITSAN